MLKRVQETIARQNLLTNHTKIVVGVSGGPDSMTLLHVLATISKKHFYTLSIAHVHYGIRGDDAVTDRNRVAAIAKKYRLPFHEKNLSATKHPTDEAWMRDTRYSFFEEICNKEHADVIAVGHTKNDLVETFFLHIIRGSGLQGLSALSYKRDNIIRPLLDVSRDDVLSYCDTHHIDFGVDTTNADTAYLRNRIRHELLPLLSKNYNPKIVNTIARLSQCVRDDYSEIVSQNLSNLPSFKLDNNTISFNASSIIQLSPSRKRLTLRIFITKIVPHLNVSFGMLDTLLKAIESTKSKTQKVTTKRLILRRNGDKVRLMFRAQ